MKEIILSKTSRYKKYEKVALIKDTENNSFIVTFHFNQSENGSWGYADTPKENNFTDEQTEVEALKQAIEKYESIRI